MADELKASPQSPALATLARMLRAARSAGDTVTVPYLGGVGTMMLGKSPEEVTEWSYGNAPLHVPQMTRVPQFKKDRAESLADTLFAAQAAAPVARMAPAAARELAPAAGALAMRAAELSGAPVRGMGVIKPKGGNWLAGSVEDAVKDLRKLSPSGLYKAEANPAIQVTPADEPAYAVNKWLETKLSKYIRNEMATPEDPIRALAEQGVLHYEPVGLYEATPAKLQVENNRRGFGFPAEGFGSSDLAKLWEGRSDFAIIPRSANEVAISLEHRGKEVPEWLSKVDPSTAVYALNRNAEGLGFSHLTDELRNAVNPESGLPAHLRWKYGDLEKVTVPQAVQRVHDINEWRAAQKVIADQARANNAAAALHKDYPDAPYKWVELKVPTNKSMPEEEYTAGIDQLRDALKYEGETMGHCVGGYCPDVLEGRSRIFSLRNKKTGEPHVTVEVKPGSRKGERAVDYRELFPENYAARYGDDSDLGFDIAQIKGKANLAPKEEYLPYVQDFVRSGKWGHVGDYGNTGLIDTENAGSLMRHMQDVYGKYGPELQQGIDKFNAAVEQNPEGLQRHMTRSEMLKFLGDDKPEGFAEGGLVDGATEYNPLEVDYIMNNVHGYAQGGLATQQVKAPFNEFSLGYDINPAEIGHAQGGSVESTHLPYDEAKISSLVNALREELNA